MILLNFFSFIILSSFVTHAETSHTTPFTIIVLGDSITEGYGLAKEQAFPALVEKQLKADGRDIKIINGGVSGSTSASGPSRLNWYLKTKPDLVIVALGANDGLRGVSVESLKKNLKEAIAIAKKAKIEVALAGMQMPPNFGAKYTRDFAAVYPAVAKEEKIPFMTFLLEGVGGVTALNQPDAIHPNEQGHIIIAKNVTAFIKKNWPVKTTKKRHHSMILPKGRL